MCDKEENAPHANDTASATPALERAVQLTRSERAQMFAESTLVALRTLSASAVHPDGVTSDEVRDLLRTTDAPSALISSATSYLNRLILMGLATKTPIPAAKRGQCRMRYRAVDAALYGKPASTPASLLAKTNGVQSVLATLAHKYGTSGHGGTSAEAHTEVRTPYAATVPSEQEHNEIIDELRTLRALGERIEKILKRLLATWQR